MEKIIEYLLLVGLITLVVSALYAIVMVAVHVWWIVIPLSIIFYFMKNE